MLTPAPGLYLLNLHNSIAKRFEKQAENVISKGSTQSPGLQWAQIPSQRRGAADNQRRLHWLHKR